MNGAQVELSVKSRSTLKFVDAEKGGRVEGDDGFAVELPAGDSRMARTSPSRARSRFATRPSRARAT